MVRWTNEAALQEIRTLLGQISELESSRSMSSGHVRWMARTASFLEEAFGPSSVYIVSFQSLRWQYSGSFVIQSFNLQRAIEQKHHEGFLSDLDSARGILLAAQDALERTPIESLYSARETPEESSGIFKILSIVERKTRKVIRTVPAKEREVQDAIEGLLIGADVEFTREAENIQYASKSYIPDFVVGKLELAMEIKLCARDGREKEIISEINDDILAYRQKFRNVLFVIYDVGFIRDVDLFSRNFEENEGVLVRVVKH